MHKRSLLIGVGIGIIIGALLLQLFNLGSDSQKQLDQISNEIKDTTLNGVSPKPEITTPHNVVDEDAKAGDELSPASSNTIDLETNLETELEGQQPSSATPDTDGQEVGREDIDKAAKPNVVAEEPAKQYMLRIPPGATVKKTAQLLVDYNIIEDTVSFAALLKERNTQIRAGFFLVEEESTNEQIRKLLSGTPLTEKERKKYNNVEKLTLVE